MIEIIIRQIDFYFFRPMALFSGRPRNFILSCLIVDTPAKMNLNISAKKNNTFDAIVVGSGISGGWAAKELCEKGLKVLLLERGKPLEHPNYPTATKDIWEFPTRGNLTSEDIARHPIQTRHYVFRGDNKHFFAHDLENPYEEIHRFDWIRADVVGGRSVLWGRQCYRWSDLDFEANAKEGIGIDWPIRYSDIAPWYTYVEKFIGVSGQAEGLPHLPDSEFQPAMEMNCVEKDLKQKIENNFPGRKVTIGRAANLTEAVKGRGVCQYRNLCHRGCPYGAYFSTNASTLPAAFATGNLTLRTRALVNRVHVDANSGKATGVEVLDMESGETVDYYAKVIFLNASTLGTTHILLNSVSKTYSNGLGNGSDQVGRNLMDHHKNSGAAATVEGFDDQYYFGRRPNGLYIPRFRNLDGHKENFLRGFGLQGGAWRGGWQRVMSDERIGAVLKESIQQPGNWQVRLSGFGECLPYADNVVKLNSNQLDKWGRPTLSIDCTFRENELNMQKDMAASTAEMLEACGYKNVKPFIDTAAPGNTNHEMGTARMGKSPKNSVLNQFNQMHEVKNVYITDGSCMTSSSCVNPSLTYMALTARACSHAVEEMKRLSL